MNYELALELKNAGYDLPTKYSYEEFVIEGDFDALGELTRYRIPTLSELIEACGDNFVRIYRYNTTHWEAHAKEELIERDATPEEAVAKLWLALNKK